jgi:peroxiredoxin
MKTFLIFVLSFSFFTSEVPTAPTVNSKAITFELKNINGETISLNSFKDSKGIILTFLTNNCPIAKMYQNRVKALQEKYGKLGFPVVAIDPADSMEDMKKVASEKGFNFYYLHDTDQKTSFSYGAIVNTHTCILTKEKDGYKIAYIGAIDDNRDESKITEKYIETAIASILAKEEIKVTKTIAKGCVISYRK